jgi:myo-inositol-1(or 4)-monophosphatase
LRSSGSKFGLAAERVRCGDRFCAAELFWPISEGNITVQLEQFLETAMAAARLGGEQLQEWSRKFTVREKNPADLVTEADKASQDVVYSHILDRYPDHGFLGEEQLAVPRGDSPYRWLIDPLDGTSNYVHHFPYYAVSIGLEYERELIVGVVYDPTRDEMFSAIRGQGARANGKKIQTSLPDTLASSLVVASLPVKVGPEHEAVKRFLRVMPHAQHIQRTGSAAMNLAYVAAGRLDAFWSTSLKPWDSAAGALIVSESGGRMSQVDGQPFDVEVPSLLASNGSALHEELQQLLP